MRNWILRGLAFLAIFVGDKYTKAEEAEPQRPFPHAVALDCSFDRMRFETRKPIIARITLTNQGGSAFRLKVRRDGPPADIGLDVAPIDQTYNSHALLLKRSGPGTEEIELQPGASTVGDLLVLLDYGERRYVFPSTGIYRVRCYWAPGGEFAKVYSDEFQVTVEPSSAVDSDVLAEIERIAMKYHGLEASVLDELKPSDARKGLEQEGLLVLARIIRQDTPHLVIPEMYPSHRREADLVRSLEDLLARYPDSSYSGYIARFLGLVYVKTLGHEVSHAGGEHWNTEKMRAHPAYPKAFEYLKKSSDAELWPRTTAVANLGRLHVMAKEWDKAEECLTKMRTKYGTIGGATQADTLKREMDRFRAKVERRSDQ